MKICLVCGGGGHLSELLRLSEAFIEHETFYITFEASTTKNLPNAYYLRYSDSAGINLRNALKFLRAFVDVLFILRREKPQVIVTTGDGVAIPPCCVGKCLGIKIIYIETLARVNKLSITGRVLYPIANVFLVQWKSLANKYRKAQYWGNVI
jgi:UDP-N-acetylglucosamine:LPS N-acetylglucosamine transferase